MDKHFFQMINLVSPNKTNPIEKALLIKTIKAMAKEYKQEIRDFEIADIVKLSASVVSQYLKVAMMPIDILEQAKNISKCQSIKTMYKICPKNYDLKNSNESFESLSRKRFKQFLKDNAYKGE